jgi:hypothetical protein
MKEKGDIHGKCKSKIEKCEKKLDEFDELSEMARKEWSLGTIIPLQEEHENEKLMLI